MDLNQRKLTKSEWDSIEVPCSDGEKDVLNLIKVGYDNIDVTFNKHKSLLSFLKMDDSDEMHYYLYITYFANIFANYDIEQMFNIKNKKKIVLKKGDKIKLENNKTEYIKKTEIFDYVLCDVIKKLLDNKIQENPEWMNEYITLYKLSNQSVECVNKYLLEIISKIIMIYQSELDISYILEKSVDIIEKNQLLLKYSDITLYQHQKEIFKCMRPLSLELEDTVYHSSLLDIPKLALYIAPTGTGKTLTPIGLSQRYKVIFICAARHVGLALSKACISANKKVAFAFGCSDANDIRLHYSAAKDYVVNKKSGGIGKVDNSVGVRVEIMICDIKSYLHAMNYMAKFNPIENLLLYWDEPTISLDYETHDLHDYVQSIWTHNIIPNIVLSSATLPKINEIADTINDYKKKFPKGEVFNICSYDCKKSIPILDKNGCAVVPHYLSDNYENILEIVKHCKDNLTLLRYIDLGEIASFITYIEKKQYVKLENIESKIKSCDDITMQKIKIYYLDILENINPNLWKNIYMDLIIRKQPRLYNKNKKDSTQLKRQYSVGVNVGSSNVINYKSSSLDGSAIKKMNSEPLKETTSNNVNGAMYISTKDAHTLTDGPTIFLADDVEKVAMFCIQQANIPSKAMEDIMNKIDYNNKINERIDILEKKIETCEEQNSKKEDINSFDNKSKKTKSYTPVETREINTLNQEIIGLRALIKSAELNDTFVPNKKLHIDKWASEYDTTKSFTSDIDHESIYRIMMLNDIQDSWKVLLLMGIGVFTNHTSIAYTEIMKKLADNQQLYLIIASSDYIYGTNYQFCHGYLSQKMRLSQEKIIQALGRIGRNNIQQDYSIRIRDQEQINKIFYTEENKIEVVNMNRLFITKDH